CVDSDLEIVTIESHDDEALLDEFHSGIYWDEFAEQQEPVAVWKRALWGGAAPYELTIRIAGRALRDRRSRIAGGEDPGGVGDGGGGCSPGGARGGGGR